MTLEENGKEYFLVRIYRILAVMLGVLGASLLACGLFAVFTEDELGMPYSPGGIIVGIVALVSAAVCIFVYIKAPNADNDVNKMKLEYAIRGHRILSIVMIVCSFMGAVLATTGGFSDSYDNADNSTSRRKTLAVVILVGCTMTTLIAICSLCVVCQYGSVYGVAKMPGRRARTIIWNTAGSMAPTAFQTTSFQTNTTINNQQIGQLEQQNRLLQQQLMLRRHLNQQQQQQTQLPDGIYPQPPPSYDSGDSAYSSAQPPSYDTIM